MVSIKKTTREGDFFHVRFRPPSQFQQIRTPDWAAQAAQPISKGSEVRMGRTDAGNWLVQSVLIERGHGRSRGVARGLAREIQQEIDD